MVRCFRESLHAQEPAGFESQTLEIHEQAVQGTTGSCLVVSYKKKKKIKTWVIQISTWAVCGYSSSLESLVDTCLSLVERYNGVKTYPSHLASLKLLIQGHEKYPENVTNCSEHLATASQPFHY